MAGAGRSRPAWRTRSGHHGFGEPPPSTSGATPATTAADELALGFYGDSGFGATPTAPAPGWSGQRVNICPVGHRTWSLLDRGPDRSGLGARRTPPRDRPQGHLLADGHDRASRAGSSGPPTAPGAPAAVHRHGRGNASAPPSTWTAPADQRQPDHLIHHDPVTSAPPPQTTTMVNGTPPTTTTTITGADQRHQPTPSPSPPPTGSAPAPPSVPLERRHPGEQPRRAMVGADELAAGRRPRRRC